MSQVKGKMSQGMCLVLALTFTLAIAIFTLAGSGVASAEEANDDTGHVRVGYVNYNGLLMKHPDSIAFEQEKKDVRAHIAEQAAKMRGKEKANYIQRMLGVLEMRRKDIEHKVRSDISYSVKEVAESRGLVAVFDNAYVAYGGVDITDDVVIKKNPGKDDADLSKAKLGTIEYGFATGLHPSMVAFGKEVEAAKMDIRNNTKNMSASEKKEYVDKLKEQLQESLKKHGAEVDETVKEVAKKNGMTVVLRKDVVVYGGRDISQTIAPKLYTDLVYGNAGEVNIGYADEVSIISSSPMKEIASHYDKEFSMINAGRKTPISRGDFYKKMGDILSKYGPVRKQVLRDAFSPIMKEKNLDIILFENKLGEELDTVIVGGTDVTKEAVERIEDVKVNEKLLPDKGETK